MLIHPFLPSKQRDFRRRSRIQFPLLAVICICKYLNFVTEINPILVGEYKSLKSIGTMPKKRRWRFFVSADNNNQQQHHHQQQHDSFNGTARFIGRNISSSCNIHNNNCETHKLLAKLYNVVVAYQLFLRILENCTVSDFCVMMIIVREHHLR